MDFGTQICQINFKKTVRVREEVCTCFARRQSIHHSVPFYICLKERVVYTHHQIYHRVHLFAMQETDRGDRRLRSKVPQTPGGSWCWEGGGPQTVAEYKWLGIQKTWGLLFSVCQELLLSLRWRWITHSTTTQRPTSTSYKVLKYQQQPHYQHLI